MSEELAMYFMIAILLAYSLIGWVANVFIFAGLIAVAYKRRFGFALSVVGNLLWMVKGIITEQPDLVAVEIVVVVLQAYAWFKWGRE